jgi:hypothetical protein
MSKVIHPFKDVFVGKTRFPHVCLQLYNDDKAFRIQQTENKVRASILTEKIVVHMLELLYLRLLIKIFVKFKSSHHMKKNYVKDGVAPHGSITFKLMMLLAILILPFGQSILTAQTITYSFTTAGATGSVGPTQTQINTAYSASNLSMVICPAGVQSWTVPNSGLYLIDCVGASGGNAPSYNRTGGLGARMQGQFNLIAGQVLQIVVGQAGAEWLW